MSLNRQKAMYSRRDTGRNRRDMPSTSRQIFDHVTSEMNTPDEFKTHNTNNPFAIESVVQVSPEVSLIKTVKVRRVPNKPTVPEIVHIDLELLEEQQRNVYYVEVQNTEMKQLCMICNNSKVVKYSCRSCEERSYICHDQCLNQLQTTGVVVSVKEYFTKFYCPVQIDSNYKYVRQCKQCAAKLLNVPGVLSWEAMDFCKEHCLYRYQKKLSTVCAECRAPVAFGQMGKYSVRFGCIVKQFCSGTCLEAKKKKIRICSYCQRGLKDLNTNIGNKYFCSEVCKGMFEFLQNPKKTPFLINSNEVVCYVCKLNDKSIKIEFDYHRSMFYFCSTECFTVFKFIQNCDSPKKCHTCCKYVLQQYLESNALYYDNSIHYFCSETCQHIYIITHRRVMPCVWCKVKKYNFDMIQKNNFLGINIFSCSLHCMNLLKDVGIYDVKCGNGVTYTFCSNHCISMYQTSLQARPPTKKATRGRPKANKGTLPVITNVCSLAPSAKNKTPVEATIKKIVIVRQADYPDIRNVATSVSPSKCTKSTSMKFNVVHVSCQTDIPGNENKISPIITPIYIPSPMWAWKAPILKPIPFPLFIPCPVLIPLTKSTAANILKEAKVDYVKGPTDPYEAELLMMAELIAEKKDPYNEPDSDTEENLPEVSYSSEGDAFNEDMLQIALKMATDFDNTPIDLEGELKASKIVPTHHEPGPSDIVVPVIPRRNTRLRQNHPRKPKKVNPPLPTIQDLPLEPIEKPDANMCLKYTFGVNAWKQWVTTKNIDLERSSQRLKLFKTELLQLTADELNYSLCLFVNEVRKPNGAEYAPDTIYYLCLGIQQFLYENGRIDNIFCDSYYEKFTECLNDICRKFTVIYNDSHYIVTRVEEEHLWESKQLGAHSPHVLLSTLMFFNTKYFNLTSVDEHMQLSFSHIMKHWKRHPNQPTAKQTGSRNVLLRFYPPQRSLESNLRKKKVYEQQENELNPLRCPVKLYEFYLSKCPESVKTRNDVFYLLPERSCVPDSPVWYSTMALDKPALEKMLHRVRMVKEINVALLTH
ncbi:PREDICTED: zinc finger MYM-type protein 3-like isoform X2 [Nicrophorus vespilloides]|uniref:Zinc finger MYM-type protein 3-like isoform X2 n=1 Tax=Nicrophorus vespilloides TaxID=110193 RepID=A0ABM1M3Z2_NICVS|nr:PREDICTED: zinc finger MYM-type protein 3-like isoform X2 [Nicrophorus vespilloides]